MIRVGFDISQIAHSGGVGIYTDHLSKELVKIKDFQMIQNIMFPITTII